MKIFQTIIIVTLSTIFSQVITAQNPASTPIPVDARQQAAEMTRRQREIPMSELIPGMVLAHGIHTANGLLLIPEGQMLNEPYIDKLRNHNRVNPIKQALLIYS